MQFSRQEIDVLSVSPLQRNRGKKAMWSKKSPPHKLTCKHCTCVCQKEMVKMWNKYQLGCDIKV